MHNVTAGLMEDFCQVWILGINTRMKKKKKMKNFTGKTEEGDI